MNLDHLKINLSLERLNIRQKDYNAMEKKIYEKIHVDLILIRSLIKSPRCGSEREEDVAFDPLKANITEKGWTSSSKFNVG